MKLLVPLLMLFLACVESSIDPTPVLKKVNELREYHRSVPVTWSAGLATSAESWASFMAGVDMLLHTQNAAYGENVAMYGGSIVADANSMEDLVVKAVIDWYSELSRYNFDAPTANIATTSHFTQLVWNSSTLIGAGAVKKNNSVWIAMHFSPAGNNMRTFQQNVFRAVLPVKQPPPIPLPLPSPPSVVACHENEECVCNCQC